MSATQEGGGGSGRRRRGLGSLFSFSSSGRQAQEPSAAETEEDERRLQRLAKNRESAQRSRQRKKEYLELLQERVHATNASLEALRLAHVQVGAPALAEARRACLEQCAADAGSGGAGVEGCLGAFGPFAEERQALLTHECRRLKGLVLPPPARFWLWLAQQPDGFFTAATTGSSGEGLPSPTPSHGSAGTNSGAPAPAPVPPSSASSTASASASAAATKAGERMLQEGVASCGAGPELWPLLCYELQLKVEQEAQLRRMQQPGSQSGGGAGGPPREELLGSGELEEVAATLAEVDALEADLLGASRLLQERLHALQQVLTPAQALVLEAALSSSSPPPSS